MASCVKNQDLGDLENNRLNVDSYQTFFQAVNEKMSYEITGLDFKNTSATVTAKITYFDGTETYKEAISAYYQILEDKKKGKSKIDRQFEYNTYIRDFFADNQGKSLEEAIKCWKCKKQLPGHNRYERSDLAALE